MPRSLPPLMELAESWDLVERTNRSLPLPPTRVRGLVKPEVWVKVSLSLPPITILMPVVFWASVPRVTVLRPSASCSFSMEVRLLNLLSVSAVVKVRASVPDPPSMLKLVVLAAVKLSAPVPPMTVWMPFIVPVRSIVLAPSANFSFSILETLLKSLKVPAVVKERVSVPVSPSRVTASVSASWLFKIMRSSPAPARMESAPPPPLM